jgi:hypothetical protein
MIRARAWEAKGSNRLPIIPLALRNGHTPLNLTVGLNPSDLTAEKPYAVMFLKAGCTGSIVDANRRTSQPKSDT